MRRKLLDSRCTERNKRLEQRISLTRSISCSGCFTVWAIGTGKVATPEIAQSVHEIIREILTGMYGEKIASETRILYGGSVSPTSVDGLLEKPGNFAIFL